MTPIVAALFVSRKGVYWNDPRCDCWDEERDARQYAGALPVVAHPPCSNWSNMAPVVQARRGMIIGSDGGCFQSALRALREFGGVLEQPAFSRAWKEFGLPRPWNKFWSVTSTGLWVCEVSQSAYGHRARKRTWLAYVGQRPAEMNWESPKGEAVVSYCKRRGDGSVWLDDRPRLTKLQASLTPPAFAEALIQLAANCGGAS